MEPEGSLPHSQVPATCPYPESMRSSPYPHIQLPEDHLNIILPSTPGSYKWFLPSDFPTKTLYTALLPPHVLHAPPISFLDFITRTILGEEYISLNSSLCSFLYSLVTSSLLGPNILLHTLFSNTLSLHSSLNVSDQVSHLPKTGKIIVLVYLNL